MIASLDRVEAVYLKPGYIPAIDRLLVHPIVFLGIQRVKNNAVNNSKITRKNTGIQKKIKRRAGIWKQYILTSPVY
jgi:hypothetical protein